MADNGDQGEDIEGFIPLVVDQAPALDYGEGTEHQEEAMDEDTHHMAEDDLDACAAGPAAAQEQRPPSPAMDAAEDDEADPKPEWVGRILGINMHTCMHAAGPA